MRRYFLSASVMLLTIALAGCNGSSQNSKTEGNDSVSADTTKTVKVETETVEETVTSSDVAFFELIGNVKKCVLKSDNHKETVIFDKDGQFIDHIEDLAETDDVRRDEQGRISEIHKHDGLGRTWADIYEYDSQGRVIKSSCNAMPDGFAYEHNYTYKNGRIVSIKGWNDGPGNIEFKYEYINEDAKGNWTERTKTTIVDDDPDPYTLTEQRTIEYY